MPEVVYVLNYDPQCFTSIYAYRSRDDALAAGDSGDLFAMILLAPGETPPPADDAVRITTRAERGGVDRD